MAADSSYCIFREIVISPQNWTRWKEITVNTGGSASTLQDVKVPDNAGGFTYNLSGCHGNPASNRFIYWRTTGDSLELTEESLDHNLSGNSLRLRFLDTSIIGDIGIHEYRGNVVILVATVTSVHRIVLPHPVKLHPSDNHSTDRATLPSIFSDASLVDIHNPNNSHMITSSSNLPYHAHAAATCLNVGGEAIFVYATNVGSMLIVKMPPYEIRGVVTQQEISQSSVMHRIWSGIVPAAIRGTAEAADTPLSLCSFNINNQTFVMSICKDNQLRMWSLMKNDCVLVSDILQMIGAVRNKNITTGSGHVIKTTLSNDSTYVTIAVYLNLAEYSQIAIFEPVYVNGLHQLNHLVSCFTGNDDLVDFCVTSTQIWLLSNDKSGHPIVKMSPYNSDGQTSPWVPTFLEPPLSSDILLPSDKDPREIYMDLIFHPGHFTVLDIHKALLNFRKSLDTQSSDYELTIDQLKEQVTTAVEIEIQNSVGGCVVPEEEYTHLQLAQWSKFYSACIQYSKIASKPKGIIADDNTGMVCVIKKGGVSYLGPCDVIDQLYSSSDISNINADDPINNADMCKLFTCLRKIGENIPEEICHEFEFSLQNLESPSEIIERVLDDILYAERPSDVDLTGLSDDIINCLQTIADISPIIHTVLGILDLGMDQPIMDEDMEAQTTSHSRLLSSGIGCDIITMNLSHLLQCRFTVCRDLLVMEKAAVILSQHIGLSTAALSSLQCDIIPQTVLLTRAYYAMYTMSDFLVTSPPNNIDLYMTQLSSLNLADSSSHLLMSDSGTNQTIASLFIQSTGGAESRRLLSNFDESDVSQVWSNILMPYTLNIARILWPMSSHFQFPEFLLCQGQFLCIEQYTRMLKNWCDQNIASRKFLLAHAYLNSDEPYKAADCFKFAKSGIHNEEFLSTKFLQSTETDFNKLDVIYYLRVIDLFEQFNAYNVIISLANTAIPLAQSDDPNLPTLWSKVFKYQLELDHYDEAYVAMTSNPDRERRNDCLRQLVTVLCKKREMDVLVQFPYIDLHNEVVETLETKARSQDLSDVSVVNYYDLLYSFHVRRDNFRSAASCMYEQGYRLGQELPTLDGLQRQVNCYVSALTLLRLVNPDYAWVVKPTLANQNQRDYQISKRFVDGQEKTPSKRKLEIVNLDDIQREFLLVDARRLLWKRNTDTASGPIGGVPEIVGLLVNAGLFDKAIVLSRVHTLQLNPIIEGLTMRCLSLSQHSAVNSMGDNSYMTKAWEWLDENDLGSCYSGREVSCTDQAWYLLQNYLQRYEDVSQRLHRSIATKLLAHDFPLPSWLIASYKIHNAAELLYLYLGYDLLEDAADLAVEYIDAVHAVTTGQNREMFGLMGMVNAKSMSVWLPWTYIDQLKVALDKSVDREYREMGSRLKSKISKYTHHLEDLQKIMIQPQ